ncbi:MAG: hypothetical protein ACREL7_02510 [Longimicrobiales bacterium]
MTYILRPDDRPLVEAAVRLGDWILEQRVSRKERKAIEKLQHALRNIEHAAGGFTAEYGFEARFGTEEGAGVYRAWRVTLSPAGLEIFSVYSPDRKIELVEKIARELDFWLRPGSGESTHDGHYVEQWIDEVRDPARVRAEAALFSILATLD